MQRRPQNFNRAAVAIVLTSAHACGSVGRAAPHGSPKGAMGRARIALSLAVALVAARAKPVAATVFDLRPSLSVGATDNPFGASSVQVPTGWEGYAAAGLTTDLQLTQARATHRFSYDIHHTWYQETLGANSTSEAVSWTSSFDLTGKTALMVGANASLFGYSAITGYDAATANPTAIPVAAGPTRVATFGANETLTFDKNGREKYMESFSALRFEPLTSAAPIATTTGLTGSVRADRQMGRNDWSLTLTGSGYIIDDDNAAVLAQSFGTGSVVTAQALLGWRRDLNANTSIEVAGGLLALYAIDVESLAIGPSVTATASYRHLPWYASLSVAQQPSVNIYLGEALISDSAVARASLPLDRRETIVVTGLGGYTYARSITGGQHFLFAPRAYDLFLLDAGIAYRFARLPLFVSADYSVTDQRGSLNGGLYIPSALRRIVSLSVGGQLAWGEGNMGWRTAR